jgi:putative oxidoreductase
MKFAITAGIKEVVAMLRELFHTSDNVLDTVLRLVLAAVYFPHGAQKVLGWFGGPGYSATMQHFTQGAHIPAFFAFLAIVAEFAGAIGLCFGLLGRVAAFGIFCVMAVAIALVHGHNGFFMNWTANKHGEGFEYHLLVIAIAVAIMIRGSGALSLDRVLTTARERRPTRGFRAPVPAHP